MYFPYLRGKQNELIAVRDLADRIASSSEVLPIIEPVNSNASTVKCLDAYAESGLRFILIVNPSVGGLAQEGCDRLIAEALPEYDNYMPAMQIAGATSSAEVSRFLDQWSDHSPGVAFIYVGQPAEDVLQTTNSPLCNYHVFAEDRTSQQFRELLPQQRTVLLTDPFPREGRNADYQAQDFFTDRNIRFGDHAGFADYSIVGKEFSEGGGPAYAVALHHVHYLSGGGSPLQVRHYVSDSTNTPVDPAGKFGEALTKLVNDLPALNQMNPLNNTSAAQEYAAIHASGYFRGLGYAKRLAIKHHIELFLR